MGPLLTVTRRCCRSEGAREIRLRHVVVIFLSEAPPRKARLLVRPLYRSIDRRRWWFGSEL